MDLDAPTALLGGLSPRTFMRRHWQKRPLLVRQAVPDAAPPLARAALFDLAARDDVESRLIVRDGACWTLRHGPLPRRALPPLKQRAWTLLVQGLDLHADAAHTLLSRFRFVPAARLDDLMLSFATDGGGVGPHLDSYDVFLLQVHGHRRWRIGRSHDDGLVPDVPLKLLRHFEPEQEWLLGPGDMLYLPPRWAHDGVAEGECMTCSIGFRAPRAGELARELMLRVADGLDGLEPGDGGALAPGLAALYRDAAQPAVDRAGRIPEPLAAFAAQALQRVLRDHAAVECALGEWLSEPKAQVWFEPGRPLAAGDGLVLDRRTRMVYDDARVYLNGESYRAAGRDARLMRQLADRRRLTAREVAALGDQAQELVQGWALAGWLRAAPEPGPGRVAAAQGER